MNRFLFEPGRRWAAIVLVTASSAVAQGESALMDPQPDLRPDQATYEPYDPMVMGGGVFGLLLIDQAEYRVRDDADQFRWDVEGWVGGDTHRFWFKTEGERAAEGGGGGEAEFHSYFSRMIAPYWDAQVGVRYDQGWEPGRDPSRWLGAVGLQGFAPLRFEVQPALFLSEDGDVSARLTATKHIRVSRRLVAQARFESEAAAQDAPSFGVGEGINHVELGFRLRYEIRREYAPYVGVNWIRKVGETKSLAQQEGEDVDDLAIVGGIRMWF